MRIVTIDGKETRVRANPLALLYYRQEFGADLMGDMAKWQGAGSDLGRFDSVVFLQLVWALAKAGSDKPAGFPDFAAWLGALESFDFGDQALLAAVSAEATDGFFRGGSAGRS